MTEGQAADPKKRIAILGGGMGSMAAAFCLTSDSNWKDKYEITVYQMGWRLGGKGASGRNSEIHHRIEEHGVHVFMGTYHNAFKIVNAAYEELGRSKDEPLACCFPKPGSEIDAAFQPFSSPTFMEKPDQDWVDWDMDFASDSKVPGSEGRIQPSILGLFLGLLKLLRSEFFASREKFASEAIGGTAHHEKESSLIAEEAVSNIEKAISVVEELNSSRKSSALVEWDIKSYFDKVANYLVRFLGELELPEGLTPNHQMRRLRVLLRTGVFMSLGILRDDVIRKGFDHLDSEDFKAWLKKHGAGEDESWSTIVQALYEIVLGFDLKDRHQPNMGAGSTLRGTLRLFMDFDGALMWKMQAGMGDAVFTPFYLVLKNRGVDFKFFHRITGLELTEDGKAVGRIGMAVQVGLENEFGDSVDISEYDPLIEVPCKGFQKPLLCWPSEPVYSRKVSGNKEIRIKLEQAAKLKEFKKEALDLESAWIPWEDAQSFSLEKGVDFDDVILGIAVGALPHLTKPLMDKSEDWRKMVNGLVTLPTQAVQLWMSKTAAEMSGNPRLDECMLASFNLESSRPWPNWVGMTQLRDRENWPRDIEIGHIGYLYTQINEMPVAVPPVYSNDPAAAKFPKEMENQVLLEIRRYLTEQFGDLWGEGVMKGTQEIDWDLLVDPADPARRGVDRLKGQYIRININPSDRYVTHAPNTLGIRLHSAKSGFQNLYLAGDWTRNGMNVGCAEAATMSGMQAARAISGIHVPIYWETDNIGIF